MLVRVNPWNENSILEVEQVIAAGADIIMLPMWKSVTDVTNFLKIVDGRCKHHYYLKQKKQLIV